MELRFLMLIWVIILMKILLARENNIKQNENKNKMLNRLSFLSENDDPQKYKGYDREGKHKSSNEPVSDSNRCRLCVRGKRK